MDPMKTRPLAIVPCDEGPSRHRATNYRNRAEELRSIADDLLNRDCQQTLLRLANSYDLMAERAEGVTGN